MRKLSRISLVLLIALAGQIWAQGQQGQGRGQGQGQGQGQGGQPAYQGKSMPASMPGTYTVIRSADLMTVVNQLGGDTPVKVADSPSGHYGAYILTYQPVAPTPGAPVNGTYHSKVAEIYYVINGTGSMALGGGMDTAKGSDPNNRNVRTVTGPSANGPMTNFKVERFSPGSVILVPPGMPHQAGYDIISKTDYLVLRYDPEKTIDLVAGPPPPPLAPGAARPPAYQGPAAPPNMPGNYMVIRGADLGAVLQQTNGDTPVRVVDEPSGHYGTFVLTYQPNEPQPGAPVRAQYHTDTAEIYYVLDGTGSMALGGTLDNATENDPTSRVIHQVSGPSASGVAKDFTVVRYSPGTVIIVPPGVPHSSGYDIITKTDMLVFRIDPKKNIDLK